MEPCPCEHTCRTPDRSTKQLATPMQLLLASNNADKITEIRAAFELLDLEFLTAADVPHIPEVVEDGDTLEENAIKKATTLARETGLWALADDTGLEVTALNGAPGVYSARYAGEDVTYEDNCRKLLAEMTGRDDRAARFRCVIALSNPAGDARTVDGLCTGIITRAARGAEGFGYDPIFQPDGHDETFAELSVPQKNGISHRGRALAAALEAWGEILKRPDQGAS